MTAVPGRISANFVIEDVNGDHANVRVNGYIADLSLTTGPAAQTLHQMLGTVGALGTAVAALTNAKVVRTGFSLDWAIAQGPLTEGGKYELVMSKAHLLFGDGTVLKSVLDIPAPVDALFLTTAGSNLKIVDPSTALPNTGLLATFQTAAANFASSPAGGALDSQFFGGQLVQGKARRRRSLPQP